MATDQPTERAAIRRLLAENIEALDDRIESARDADMGSDDERLQLARLRTMAQLTRQYRLLARDADVDEMDEQVTLLREALAGEDA